MSWGDFKKSYTAGGDAYREAKSRWIVPVAVVIALTAEICRRHGISWTYLALVIAVVLALFIVVFIAVERYVRRRDGQR